MLDFVQHSVFPYMASLIKEDPQIAEYFRDAVLEIDDPNILKQLIDEVELIEFTKLKVGVKSDIIEYLLTQFEQLNNCEFFRTPQQIRALMLEMIDPDIGDTIYDPACGTGGLLVESVRYILAKQSSTQKEIPIYGEDWLEKRGQSIEEAKKEFPNLHAYRRGTGDRIQDWSTLERSIFGVDVSRYMMRISMMNLMLHGIRRSNIKRANSLVEMEGLSDEDIARKYKVILSNPPFGQVHRRDSVRTSLTAKSTRVELLFLEVMMESLALGGRCAVIVPETLLFGSTLAHKNLRKNLIEYYDLLAVVSLPTGVLGLNMVVKTSVLVFQRPTEKLKKIDKVWFYEVSADGFGTKRQSAEGRIFTPDKNDIPDLLMHCVDYKESGFKKPTGVKSETLISAGSAEPKCWWANTVFLSSQSGDSEETCEFEEAITSSCLADSQFLNQATKIGI